MESRRAGSDSKEGSGKIAPALPRPIPVLEDGTLELDLGVYAHMEKVAPVPLQYRAPSQSQNHIQRLDDNPGMKAVNVYVNKQGQKVKLAQLAPAPPIYSVSISAHKTLAANQESFREKKNVGDGDTSHVPPRKKSFALSKNASSDACVTKRCSAKRSNFEVSCTSSLLNGSSSQSVSSCGRSGLNMPAIKTNTLKTQEKPSIEFKNHQNARDCPTVNGAAVSESDANEVVDPDHPSAVKEELNQGLEKIMQDLAALDLPQHSNNIFVKDTGLVYMKKSISTIGESVHFDHGKENDSPLQFSSINVDDADPSSQKETTVKRPHISIRSGTKSFYNCANVVKTSKLDSKKSSTSSLNSAHKSIELNDTKTYKPAERQKSYDPVKAREYIRQQKQDRLNRLKAERERQQADMQTRKQKLDELSRTSLKLVKASVKRKPNSGNNEDKSIDLEDFSSTGCEVPGHLGRQNLRQNSSENLNQNSADQYSFSNIPTHLSHDDSSAQLIKDICEMKNKIEAIAKTLRTTVTAKRLNVNQPAVVNARGNSVSGSLLKESSSHAIIANRNSEVKSSDALEQARPDSKVQQPYLQNLTSNLRKIRESLQGVLNEKEIQSSTSSVKCLSTTARSSHQRHCRFSSAGSDSAFDSIKHEVSYRRAPSLDGHLSSDLQKKRITTSFPTLPFVETQNIIFDRNKYCGANPESGHELVTDSNTFAPATPVSVHQEKNLDPCCNEMDGINNSDKDQTPEWFEPITSRPYPINFISVVKRKLGSSIKGEHSDDLSECRTATSTVRQDVALPEHFSKHSSLDINLELPPFVTVRNSVCSDVSPAAWTSAQPSNLAATLTASNPLSPTTLHQQSDERDLKEDIKHLSSRSTILDALNLEEMQVEFTRALNPCSVRSSDLTPAEKPLSAPNTPAKTSLKLTRPVSLGRTGKLNFNGQIRDTNKLEDNNELVPPNVRLTTGRIERKSGSVDSWVSHSRGCGEFASTNQNEEFSVAIPESSSSKDTFEIGQVFNPTALHLQFQAELNILDSFNESLCQVMEVEKVRAVALARHQALSEIQSIAMPTEDKAINVQTDSSTLIPEISSINYQRGSKDPCDVTVLDIRTSECVSAVEALSNDSHSFKECGLSPLSTAASDTVVSSTKEKTADSPILSIADEKNGSQLDTSVEKSISEDIYTMSDSVPEEGTSKLDDNVLYYHIDPKENSKTTDNSDILSCLNVPKALGEVNTLDQSLSVDLSVDSIKGDSTFPGDALIVDSINSSDKHLFPTLVTGEDMFQFNLQMLEQLMHEEELRMQHRNTLLKLRVKVLGEMARTEVAALDLDKKKLRERGDDGHKDQMTALRKKQRGIMLRFQQQREEIERIRRTEELAWQERRLMYLQQMHLIRMQISTHVMLHKFDKCGGNVAKKSRAIVKSIQDNKSQKITVKSLGPEISNVPAEVPSGLTVTQSSSVSMASLASDGSKSSAISNSSRRGTNSMVPGVTSAGDNLGAAGDSESSHLEECVLRGLDELESRCRNLKERENVLHERRQTAEQIIQWRRKLEEEERRLREVERQAHSRHRNTLAKHVLRDRSTSPFQFSENGVQGNILNAGSGSVARNIQDVPRNGRSNAVNTTGSASGSASVTEDVDSSIPEEIGDINSKPSEESTVDGTNVDQYGNESFESEVSEVKAQESQSTLPDGSQTSNHKELPIQLPPKIESHQEARLPKLSERSNKYPGVTIKVPLSPHLQRVQRRRYSSGSDDSVILSQTETGSEQSDIEGRISALSEQLHQCKAEAERLRKEAKRTRNERLIAKEQSLHKQLQAYESYICQLRRNLEAELRQSSVPIVRPQIKQPRVSPGKVASRRQDADVTSTPGSDRSVSQAASPETASSSFHREEIDPEPKEFETVSEAVSIVVSEGASEIVSEVPSDVASEGASEVSENSNLFSQDAPSLVENKSTQENPSIEPKSFVSEDERTSGASSKDECKAGIMSVAKSDEPEERSLQNVVDCSDKEDIQKPSSIADTSQQELETCMGVSKVSQSVLQTSKEIVCSHHEVLSSYPGGVVCGDAGIANAEKSLNKDYITASVNQVKSVSSEEEIDEMSETIDDDQADFAETRYETNVIQVFVREKEKETSDSSLLMDAVVESVSPSSKIERTSEEIVDAITNGLLKDLLGECLRTATPTHTPSKDAYWSRVVNTSLHEATVDILSIYERRLHKAVNQQTDVRKRVSEILAETQVSSKLKAEGRIKEIMTTAYGVLSPDDSPCGSPNLSSSPIQQSPANITSEDNDTTYNKMAEASAMKSNVGKASDPQVGLIGENVVDSDGVSQDWFDEDFGLTRRRQEAEELHRQQLLIEQEIEQLQQQKAQVQEQIPYYYVREIPNKPPPPYTPPGQAPRVLSSSSSLTSSVEEVRAVCTDRPVILKAINTAVDVLYEARCQGLELENQEAPNSFLDAGFGLPHLSHLSDQELSVHKNSAKVYRTFLFDLAKELVLSAYSCEAEDPSPPWLRPDNWVRRRKALTVVPKTKEMLHEIISRQVLVLFGFVPKASKENLTIRWSRKKRDHVDELLVRESQEEERQWTNYEQDEAVVKNNVAMAILDSLLDDTVQVLRDVFRRREQRHCPVL